jgi:putative ABC transport system permease protein
LNILVLRKGATAELAAGGVDRDALPIMKDLPGVAHDRQGQPMVSGEDLLVIVLPRNDGSGETNVTVRFMTPMGMEMRPEVKLASGQWFTPGQREIVVSNSIHKRFAQANIGDSMWIGKGPWKVVGIFDSAGSAHDSEIWGDINQLAADFDRVTYNSALIRATDPVAADALKNRVSDDQRLKLNGMLETDYWAKQTSSGAPIKYVGTIVAIIMAIGSCFAAMNTMYAAVAYRSREIATLRVIGFSRPSILTSFVFESILLALLGAAVGVLLMLPMNGMTTGTNNPVTFSEAVFSLRMTPAVVGSAVLFAIIMGLLGGIPPAWHAAKQEILASLRD